MAIQLDFKHPKGGEKMFRKKKIEKTSFIKSFKMDPKELKGDITKQLVIAAVLGTGKAAVDIIKVKGPGLIASVKKSFAKLNDIPERAKNFDMKLKSSEMKKPIDIPVHTEETAGDQPSS